MDRPYMAIELRPVTDSSKQLYTASPTECVSNVLASLPIRDPPEKGKDVPHTDTWGTPPSSYLPPGPQANSFQSVHIWIHPFSLYTVFYSACFREYYRFRWWWLTFFLYSRLWKPASVCFHAAGGVSLCISPNLRWFLIQRVASRADCRCSQDCR